MEPNYNFENEIQDQYKAVNLESKAMLKELLINFKLITQKEYDVAMWMFCNLPVRSVTRVALFENLKKVQLKARLNKLANLQNKLEL